MKTHIITFITAIFILASCGTGTNNQPENEPEASAPVDNTARTEAIFKEFQTLYSELLAFKDKDDFKAYGFGKGGPYNEWLGKVESLKKNPDAKLLLSKGVVAGELEQLGLAYATSKGQETESTSFFNKTFSDAINQKPIEVVETSSGNANYDNLKKDYELFGKWSISAAGYSYPYEIYKKENEYIGVKSSGEYKTEILDKKGNDYYVKGNKFGEFYRIDKNLNLTLFDRDGDLTSAGYRATKQ